MFDPALRGYWNPADPADLDAAADALLAIVADHADRVDGVKVSLLDTGREVALRRRLPEGVRLYTGDDFFNYPELIAGDGERHSDAPLGVFDPIAPAAAAALRALDAATRTTSGWSPGWRAGARSCASPSSSCSPKAHACCRIPR